MDNAMRLRQRVRHLNKAFGVNIMQILKDFGVKGGVVRDPICVVRNVFSGRIVGKEKKGEPGAWQNVSRHMIVVSGLARAMAENFTQDQNELDRIELAGMVHDAGKFAEGVAKGQGGDIMQIIKRVSAETSEELHRRGVPGNVTALFPEFSMEFFKNIDEIRLRMQNGEGVSMDEILTFLLFCADYYVEGQTITDIDTRHNGIITRCKTDEERMTADYDYENMKTARDFLAEKFGIGREEFTDKLKEMMAQSK